MVGGMFAMHFIEYQQTKILIEMRQSEYASCAHIFRVLIMVAFVVLGLILFTYVFGSIVDLQVINNWIVTVGFNVVVDQIVFEILKFWAKKLSIYL
jgi:hypothetical protein